MTQTYPTAETRQHSVIARVTWCLAAVLLLGAVLVVLSDRSQRRGESLFLLAPVIGLSGLGVYFWQRRNMTLDVDLASRRATFRTQGQERWRVTLDELAPLTIVTDDRKNYENGGSIETEYRVVTTGAQRVPLFSDDAYPRVRRVAEGLAREWRVAFRSLDGRLRRFEELDDVLITTPTDSATTHPTPLPRGIVLDRSPARVVIRSKSLRQGTFLPGVVWLVAACVPGLFLPTPYQWSFYRLVLADPLVFPREAATLAAVGFGLATALCLFVHQTWVGLRPATLIVEPELLSYGRHRVRFADLREIVWADALCILGSKHAVEIPSQFYDSRDEAAMIDLLRRLIRDMRAARS